MDDKLKKHETIAACGIDCGLCPRFYTKGNSACPGCGGLNFKEKHPNCGVLTCCVIKNGFETCAECKEFPCSRFKTGNAGCDSFTTHKKMNSNLNEIKTIGIEQFVEKQKIRIDILCNLLTNYDNGRTKSFFCQTCALFPIDKLQEIHKELITTDANADLKEINIIARKLITKTANTIGVDLKLNKKIK
ncbi:DUF3795 domain-containing protein [Paludibacter sp.]|uniref:DUF3795 domain-containing protein n=1 Tax=Paludibacter sp. TaxID=1898105 RepID=UPI001354A5EA|nr:DUF3795 domain-containing protein [Paludibacter sp.]MTK51916.1 DUF3795 domain-containing protein [Paludibacter sp.]